MVFSVPTQFTYLWLMKIFGTTLAVIMSLCIGSAQAQDSTIHESVDENQRLPECKMVGEVAPDFSVRDLDGQTVNSKNVLREGPLVLVFFQGSWNGEDTEFLFQLNDSINELKNLNAQVVAVSMEQVQFIKMLLKKEEINFTLAQDAAGILSKAFGVIYSVDDDYCKQLMQKGNINLYERYDSEMVSMSAPTVLVISQNGKIVFSRMDFDSGNRPYVSELVHAISQPGEQRMVQPVLEEAGGEPVKKKRRKRNKK